MSSCVVVGGILLAGDQLFRMEKLTVSSGSNLINDGWLKIDEDGTRHVLAGSGLGEESGEGVVPDLTNKFEEDVSLGPFK
jgi:hypothetical protein